MERWGRLPRRAARSTHDQGSGAGKRSRGFLLTVIKAALKFWKLKGLQDRRKPLQPAAAARHRAAHKDGTSVLPVMMYRVRLYRTNIPVKQAPRNYLEYFQGADNMSDVILAWIVLRFIIIHIICRKCIRFWCWSEWRRRKVTDLFIFLLLGHICLEFNKYLEETKSVSFRCLKNRATKSKLWIWP